MLLRPILTKDIYFDIIYLATICSEVVGGFDDNGYSLGLDSVAEKSCHEQYPRPHRDHGCFTATEVLRCLSVSERAERHHPVLVHNCTPTDGEGDARGQLRLVRAGEQQPLLDQGSRLRRPRVHLDHGWTSARPRLRRIQKLTKSASRRQQTSRYHSGSGTCHVQESFPTSFSSCYLSSRQQLRLRLARLILPHQSLLLQLGLRQKPARTSWRRLA